MNQELMIFYVVSCTVSYFIQSSIQFPHRLHQPLQTCSQIKLCIRESKINLLYLVYLHPRTHGMSFQTFCPLLNIQNSFPISSGVSIFHLFFIKREKKLSVIKFSILQLKISQCFIKSCLTGNQTLCLISAVFLAHKGK